MPLDVGLRKDPRNKKKALLAEAFAKASTIHQKLSAIISISLRLTKTAHQHTFAVNTKHYWRIDMRFFISCLVLVQASLFCCQEKQPCLRALIVYDTSKTDIQIASTADVARMKETFEYIATQTGLRFHPTVVKANELSKKAFQKWLRSIRPSRDEVALFYYSGQGRNTKKSKWPSITIGKELRLAEDTVAKKIKASKPKLGIVVFDCYNRPVSSQGNIDFKLIPCTELSKLPAMPGLKNIFRANKGVVLGCPCKGVQQAFYSAQKPPIGGVFTSQFISGLFAYSRDARANWNNVGVHLRSCADCAHIKPLPILKYRVKPEFKHFIKSDSNPTK